MLTTEPEDQEYGNQTLACFKTEINGFRRKRPFKCIDRHDNVSKFSKIGCQRKKIKMLIKILQESSIELCGRGSRLSNFSNLTQILFIIIWICSTFVNSQLS